MQKDSGFTLIEILVAVAVLSMMSVAIATQITNLNKSEQHLQIRAELSAVRDSYRAKTDCIRTLKPFSDGSGAIACSGAIDLKDRLGNVIPMGENGWTLAATCSNTALTVTIERRKSGVLLRDPLTGRLLDANNASINPLFGRKSSQGLCEEFFFTKPRVKTVSTQFSNLPGTFSGADCALINPTLAPVLGSDWFTNPTTLAAFTKYDMKANEVDNACSQFCQASPHFAVGGYVVDCTNMGDVDCVCIR